MGPGFEDPRNPTWDLLGLNYNAEAKTNSNNPFSTSENQNGTNNHASMLSQQIKTENLLHHLHADSRLLEHSNIDTFNCNKRAGWLIEKRRIKIILRDHFSTKKTGYMYLNKFRFQYNQAQGIVTFTTLKRKAPSNSDRVQMSLQ